MGTTERFSFSNPAPPSLFVDLLAHIDIGTLDYDLWFRVSCGLKSSGCPYSVWDDWNSNDPYTQRYTPAANRSIWAAIDPGGAAQFGTVMEHAKRGGFRPVNGQSRDVERIFELEALREAQRAKQTEAQQKQAEKQAAQAERQRARTARNAARIIERSRLADNSNPYLTRKLVAATPNMFEIDAGELRAIVGYQVRARAKSKSDGESKPLTGRILVLPVVRGADIINVELIDGSGLKAGLYGKGTKAGGYWAPDLMPRDTRDLGDGTGLAIAIGEGAATTISGLKGFGKSKAIAVAALTSGNLPKVALAMRGQFPKARIVLLADIDKRKGTPDAQAVKAAQAVGGWLAVPEFQGPRDPEKEKDFNDLWCKDGIAQVALSIDRARPVEPAEVADDPEVDDAGKTEFPPLPDTHRRPARERMHIDAMAPKMIEAIETALKLQAATGKRFVLVFSFPPGAGKTQALIKWLIEKRYRAVIATPTHDLADQGERLANLIAETDPEEFVEACLSPELPSFSRLAGRAAARSLKGRGAKLDKAAEQPLYFCRKPKTIAACKERKVLQHFRSIACVRKYDDGTVEECEFKSTCPYYAQMTTSALIRLVPHNLLYAQSELGGVAIKNAKIATIDESPISAGHKHRVWSDHPDFKAGKAGTLQDWRNVPELEAIRAAVTGEKPLTPEERKNWAIWFANKVAELGELLPGGSPNMSDDATAETVLETIPEGALDLRPAFVAARDWLDGDTNTLRVEQIGTWPALVSDRMASMAMFAEFDRPIVLLDATMTEETAKILFPDREVQFFAFDAPLAEEVTVLQCRDASFYADGLDFSRHVPDDKTKPPSDRAQARLRRAMERTDTFTALARSIAENGLEAGFVSYKAVANLVDDRVKGLFVAHYGNERGMNHLQGVDVMLGAGRLEPSAKDAENLACALFPKANLDLCGKYEKYLDTIELKGGSTVQVAVNHHKDPIVDGVLQSIREAGLIQGPIGRMRPYRPLDKPRVLMLFCNVPVPGLKVDATFSAKDLPDHRLARALMTGNGTAPIDPEWLREKLPEDFRTTGAAAEFVKKHLVAKANKGVPIWVDYGLSIYLSRKLPKSEHPPDSQPIDLKGNAKIPSILAVSYRLAGSFGKERKALTWFADLGKVRPRLEKLHGDKVAEIEFVRTKPADTLENAGAAAPKADRDANKLAERFAAGESVRVIAESLRMSASAVHRARVAWTTRTTINAPLATIDTLDSAPPSAPPAVVAIDTLEAAMPDTLETIETLEPAPAPALPVETAVPASTVATVWTVTFRDGRTATLTTPGGASQAEAAESAKNLMGGVVAVVPRGQRANAASAA